MAKLPNLEATRMALGNVFTPRTPINVRELFAGRITQLQTALDAVAEQGCHVVIFGERGVGKTSLANVLTSILQPAVPSFPYPIITTRVACDGSTTFGSMWRQALGNVVFKTERGVIGFNAQPASDYMSLAASLPDEPTPSDVLRIVRSLGDVRLVAVFDEFDRVASAEVRGLTADVLKALSDDAVASTATVVLVGVAESVDGLISQHGSVERALSQIHMPRMSSAELEQLVGGGFEKAGCAIRDDAKRDIVRLSQGLPYIAHLLALHSGRAALGASTTVVAREHVLAGTKTALNEWSQSVTSDFRKATQSNQPDHIYVEVLIACALAKKDDAGFFAPASVRSPLNEITGKDYKIASYALHLAKFSEPERGGVLERKGRERKWRYRFASPMLRAYAVLRGVVDNHLTDDLVAQHLEA